MGSYVVILDGISYAAVCNWHCNIEKWKGGKGREKGRESVGISYRMGTLRKNGSDFSALGMFFIMGPFCEYFAMGKILKKKCVCFNEYHKSLPLITYKPKSRCGMKIFKRFRSFL